MSILSKFSCFVALLAAASLFTSCMAHGNSPLVKYSNCTDEALCLSGCQSAVVASDTCLAFASNQSEIISCDPVISVCGDLSYYADAQCSSQLWFTNAFVCGTCNKNANGQFSTVKCDSTDGTEFIAIYNCPSSSSSSNSSCSSPQCTNPWNVTKGTCIPTEVKQAHIDEFSHRLGLTRHAAEQRLPKVGQVMYAMYTGATTCTSLTVTQWKSNSKCQGEATVTAIFPDNCCIRGASFQCQY